MSDDILCYVQLILGDRVLDEIPCSNLELAEAMRNALYNGRSGHEGDLIRVLSVDGELCFADIRLN